MWYRQLFDMEELYDYTGDDGRMRYISLLDPSTGFGVGLVWHATNTGEDFSEFHTGLDHLEFLVARREDLSEWADRLDQLRIAHSGVKEPEYTRNAMLTFRDPDNIQLEFFWRAPAV
jgi:catechol 2,3-dioxygenase-like lactoylglutathione lyase family enzyme